jgi:Zn-dependent peptidase ImmA (M78 family)
MTDSQPNELARRQILAAAERAIREAGVAGIHPTPLQEIEETIGVKDVIDMSELPDELRKRKPKRWKRILGAYLYDEEVIFVDRDQARSRIRFAEAHEIGHKIVPWHRGSFQLDNNDRIFGDTEELLENEAKLAGAHLIFGGSAFIDRALEFETGIDTPIALSGDYDASMHVTIRHYVEQHPEPIAVLITGRYENIPGLPIYTSIASASWRERYGDLAPKCGGSHLAVVGGEGSPFGDIIDEARSSTQTVAKAVKIRDRNGDQCKCIAEAFFNQYNVFVMCSERRLVRHGRRLRVRAS